MSGLAMLLDPAVQIDHAIALWLNQFAGHDGRLDRFVYNIADSAIFKGGLFMAFFWWQWFRRDGGTDQRRQIIITALAGGTMAIAVARALQLALPFRARPIHNDDLALTLPIGMDAQNLDGWSSFPSDHAVLFLALSVAVWRLQPRLGQLALLWTLLVICLPRLFLGYHYATDILAGGAVGVVVMSLTFLLLHPALLARPLLRWEGAHATSFYCIAFLASLELAVLFQDLRQLVSDSLSVMQYLTATSGGPAT